jgi:hypothetical protein
LFQYIASKSKIKYTKKFRLLHPNGKPNRVGPGYQKNDEGELVISNHAIYHPNVENVLMREKKKYERKREKGRNILQYLHLWVMKMPE